MHAHAKRDGQRWYGSYGQGLRRATPVNVMSISCTPRVQVGTEGLDLSCNSYDCMRHLSQPGRLWRED
jgi:hypothetical protein